MIKWHQMTGQQGYNIVRLCVADAAQRLLNPGGPLMKHWGRQREISLLIWGRWDEADVWDLFATHTVARKRATPGSLTKFNTEPSDNDTACRRWVSQKLYERGKSQRPLNLCFSHSDDLACECHLFLGCYFPSQVDFYFLLFYKVTPLLSMLSV